MFAAFQMHRSAIHDSAPVVRQAFTRPQISEEHPPIFDVARIVPLAIAAILDS